MLDKDFPKSQPGVLANRPPGVFLFGPFRLDPAERVLLRGAEPVALTPRAFDTLLVLVSNAGRLVEKDRLLEEVWRDAFVEEKTLAQNVLTIRRALGKTDAGTHYVKTIPKHGYRFAAEVRHVVPDNHEFITESRSRTELVVEEEYEIEDAASGVAADAPAVVNVPAVASDARRTEEAPTAVAALPSPTSADVAPRKGGRRKPLLVAVCVAAACVVAAAAAAFILRRGEGGQFREFQMKRLTTTGDVAALAISPDGKFVAYASAEAGRSRLLVRQVEGTRVVEVTQPAEVRYVGTAFSPDGSQLYYVQRQMGDAGIYGDLFSVPVLGGPAKHLIHDVDSPVAVAPDGRLAFVRVSVDQREAALVVADAAGSNERRLAARPTSEGFSVAGPAWSPDGRLIVCASNADPSTRWDARLLVVDTADGSVKPFSADRWRWIGRTAWASDGRGIFLVAWSNDSPTMSEQVWYVSYPGGVVRRVTNDVNGYPSVSVSADSRAIVVARSERVAGFYAAPLAGAGEAQKLGGVSADSYGERYGLSWAPDGRVLYASSASGEPNIWVMNADGSQRTQLTSEHGGNVEPVVSPDGRTIVFVSYRTGARRLWRMDFDGGNQRQLTNGAGDGHPDFTPDGRWVIYSSFEDGRPSVWKVPAEGGEPQRLSDLAADMPAVSPDGKFVAFYRYADPVSRPKVALVSLDDCKVVREFDPPHLNNMAGVRWTPDGGGLVYLAARAGVGNLWLQPADGSPARALTDFNSDRIFRFDVSPDGSLVYERGTNVVDAILLRST